MPGEPAPRPWRLHVSERELTVRAADGSYVEHRVAGGFTPAAFARHCANAALYVDAVNAREQKSEP